MKDRRFILMVLLVILVQILLWSNLNLFPRLIIILLPTIILVLPVKINDISVLVLAFLIGFVTDFFATGITGLTISALLPVAYFRKWIITLLFGEELSSRGEGLSIRKSSYGKFTLAIFLANTVFLLVYIWIDAAGTRSFSFNLTRYLFSILISTPLGLLVSSLLDPPQKRWK